MPEGDTIYRAARTFRHALAGRTVTRFESVFPHLTRVAEDTPILGRTIDDVQSAGKHLLIILSGDLVLRSHLRMNGLWHLYRPGERWQRSPASARIVIGTDAFVAVAFNVHDASFHTARTLPRDSIVGQLGPDLLSERFDEDDAVRRLLAAPDDDIATALLDQRRVAGIGNVYKSETLFLCGIHPFRRVGDVAEEDARRLIRTARRLMLANVAPGSGGAIVTYTALRRTTGRSNPAERLWVYGRGRKPCRRCETPIEWKKTGENARSTYWCPRCQPLTKISGSARQSRA